MNERSGRHGGRISLPAVDPETALALLFVSVLALLVFSDCVFRGQMLFQRDLSLFSWGWMEALVDSVANGSWPLWNPFPALGEPLLATATAQVLYPTTWLNLVMSFPSYVTWFALIHLVVGGLGARALARGLGGSSRAALVSAAAWATSGPVLSTVHMCNMYAALAWLPWAVHFARRTLAEQTRRAALLWGAALALTILAGSPETSLMALAATPVLAAERGLRDSVRRRPGRTAALVAIAAAAAILLSAAQALPTMELQRSSYRSTPAGVSRTFWSNHPFITAQAVLPLALDPLPLNHDVRQLLFEGRDPFLYSVYLGGPLLGLVLAGLAFGRNPHRLPVALLGICGFAFSFGAMTPLYGALVRGLPFLMWFRFPAKAVLLAALAFAVLAGFGVEAWSAPRRGGRLAWLAVVALPVATLAAVAWHLAQPTAPLWSRIAGPPLDGRGYDSLAEFARMSRHLVTAAILLLAVAVLAIVRAFRGAAAPTLAAGAALLGVLDLAVQMRELNPSVPRAYGSYLPAILEPVGRRRPNRTLVVRYSTRQAAMATRLLRHNTGVGVAIDAPPVALFAAPRDYPISLGAGGWGIEGFPMDVPSLRSAEATLVDDILQTAAGRPEYRRWLQVFGIQYLVTLHREPLPLLATREMPLLMGAPTAYLWGVPDTLPRAYWASRASPGAMDELVTRVVLDPAFDLRDEVLIAPPASVPNSGSSHTGAARIVWMKPDAMEIATESTAPGHAVVTEAFVAGWRATVDGAETPVLRANGVLRAVQVPAGRHRVTLRYRPRSVLLGLALSASGVLGAIALWLTDRRKPTPA